MVIALGVFVLGLWVGGHPSWLPGSLRNAFEENSPSQVASTVLDTIGRDYYRKVSRNQLIDKGLVAMVASLNDPYSRYYPRDAYHRFLNQSNPHFGGIGVDVIQNPRGLRVIDVFPRLPAARAGLEHGDLIVKVDSTPLAGRTADYASKLIRGRVGSRVKITAQRGRRTLTFSIVRANVVVPVASGKILQYHGKKVGYLRLTSFTSGAGDELRNNVRKVLHQGAQALVLDMRENGGGLLQEAVDVGSIFIPDGTIVSTRGRSQPTQVYTAKHNAIAPRIPMVVLVDRDTASSAEIVTGALKDHGRAEVVGTHTYGKGVFQEIEPMPGGGALDITVGEYFTPSGQNLGGGGVRQGKGIKPDVYAYTSATARSDQALTTAERTVVARVR
ncbi:MAG: S41 family peptidase [Solirubrobacteraceae bacterium]